MSPRIGAICLPLTLLNCGSGPRPPELGSVDGGVVVGAAAAAAAGGGGSPHACDAGSLVFACTVEAGAAEAPREVCAGSVSTGRIAPTDTPTQCLCDYRCSCIVPLLASALCSPAPEVPPGAGPPSVQKDGGVTLLCDDRGAGVYVYCEN